jgi:hypothetical protein
MNTSCKSGKAERSKQLADKRAEKAKQLADKKEEKAKQLADKRTEKATKLAQQKAKKEKVKTPDKINIHNNETPTITKAITTPTTTPITTPTTTPITTPTITTPITTPTTTKTNNDDLKYQTIKMITDINDKFTQMPYYRNYEARTGFVHNITSQEDAVKDILLSENLTQFETKQPQKVIYEWLNNPELSLIMPVNSYIPQPCGQQQSPDFIVKFIDGRILAIECKSSSSTIPLYNSGGIKQNYFYVFSSKDQNKTVTYMGSDIINDIQQKLIDDHIKDARERDEILNKKLKEYDTNNRGVCYYTRPMIGQSGGHIYTNYFTHKNKEINGKSVIKFMSK